jgi:hypothetical protein
MLARWLERLRKWAHLGAPACAAGNAGIEQRLDGRTGTVTDGDTGWSFGGFPPALGQIISLEAVVIDLSSLMAEAGSLRSETPRGVELVTHIQSLVCNRFLFVVDAVEQVFSEMTRPSFGA